MSFIDWNFDVFADRQLRGADFLGADSTAEKGRGRGTGVWRRRGGRAVWRGFGQCADQDHQMGGGTFLRAGVGPRP